MSKRPARTLGAKRKVDTTQQRASAQRTGRTNRPRATSAKTTKAKVRAKTRMPNRISPDANIYGTYAKTSALADYMEVCTLRNVRISKATLADLVGDRDWQLRELIVGPDEDAPERLADRVDLSRDVADRVFTTLRERQLALPTAYPFEVGKDYLTLRDGFDVANSPYVSMLAITVTHAYKLEGAPRPTDVLEDVVADALKTRLPLAINFGRVRRGVNTFENAVVEICPLIELDATPGSAWRAKFAQDENVDTIGHITWGDQRAGAWAIVGQATCAKSDEWEVKLDEPKAATWAKFLGVIPHPLVFLAIPHHIEDQHLYRLVQGERGIVLDRLRLARFRQAIASDERELVDRMLNADLEAL